MKTSERTVSVATGVSVAFLVASCTAIVTPPSLASPPPSPTPVGSLSHPEPPATPPPLPSAIQAPKATPAEPDGAPSRVQHGVDMTTWDGHFPAGWTDPRVVAGIAKGCDFTPVPLRATPWDDDVFACALGPDQTCVPTPCLMDHGACTAECNHTCAGCTAACTTTCDACESACTTDACRHACAVTTGACKDACTRAIDRCRTGKCNAAEKACDRAADAREKAEYPRVKACAERCPAVQECERTCPTGNTADERANRGACIGMCVHSAQDLGCPTCE